MLRLVFRLVMCPRLLLPPRLLDRRASELAGETEVADDGPALVVEEDVLGLDVPVDDALVVEMLKGDELPLPSESPSLWQDLEIGGDLPAPRTIAVLDAQGRRRVA